MIPFSIFFFIVERTAALFWYLVLCVVILLIFVSACHAAERVVVASFYVGGSAKGEGGNFTATGKRYDRNALTCAHRSLAFGTLLRVCRVRNCILVSVNDRGPYIRGREIDLSYGSAKALQMVGRGVAKVRVGVPLPRPRPQEIDANGNENRSL